MRVRNLLTCNLCMNKVNVLLSRWLVSTEKKTRCTYFVTVAPDSHKEVIGFDVSVYEVFGVNILDATNHLKQDKHLKLILLYWMWGIS